MTRLKVHVWLYLSDVLWNKDGEVIYALGMY